MKERTVQLTKYFINHEEVVTFDQLISEFQVSSRTLRNDISQINKFLSQQNFSSIKTIRNKGLIFTISPEKQQSLLKSVDKVSEVMYFTPEERMFDLILSIALDRQPTYLYEKEAAYQVSKSTMDDDIRKVRQLLAKYDISAVSIPKQGLVLSGSERTIRTMLYDIIIKFIVMVDYQAQISDQTVLEKILFTYISKRSIRMLDEIYDQTISDSEEDIYRKQLLLFTAVWLERFNKGNTIAKTIPENPEVKETETLKFIDCMIEKFDLDVAANERKYLAFILETFNKKDMSNSIEWVQAQLLTIQLIQHVERETKIPFSRREELLYEGLYKHITGLLHRMKHNFQVVNPLQENITTNYSEIYQSILNFSPLIEEVANNKMTKDEIAFLTIYFSTSESQINQELEYIYKAAVICNYGTATAHLLAENLKELFNIEIVAVLSSREVGVLSKIDVDLLFSTVRIENPKLPTLLLSPILREKDKVRIKQFLTEHQSYRRVINEPRNSTSLLFSLLNIIELSGGTVTKEIYQKVEKTFVSHHLKINQEEIQPMLEDVLNDSGILLNMPSTTWEEAIEDVAKPLVENSVIEPRYITAMIDSVKEFGAYIVIGKNLALAHARPEDGVNQLGISVLTLKEPVIFGHDDNDPVKIVFCLAAVDSYSHLNIMKELVALIHDESKVEKLIKTTSKQQFKELLYTKITQ